MRSAYLRSPTGSSQVTKAPGKTKHNFCKIITMVFTFQLKNLSALTARFPNLLRRLAVLSERVTHDLHIITGKRAKDCLISNP